MTQKNKKKIIHVNRAFISHNANGGNRPVYTVKEGGKTTYAREVIIKGESKLVYTGDQLSCGARAWIETTADIVLIDPMTFQEAQVL